MLRRSEQLGRPLHLDDPPRCITAIRSQTCAATRRSWVMNRMARPRRRWRSRIRSRTCACTETSRAETGSSATSTSGSSASARAMPMRWRWPPENSCGIALGRACLEADEVEKAPGLLQSLAGRHALRDRAFGDDAPDPAARIERGVGVLEDHLDAPAVRPEGGRRQVADRQIADPDRAPDRARGGAGSSARPSTCRSRIRRRGPSVSPRRTAKPTSSTAWTSRPRRKKPAAAIGLRQALDRERRRRALERFRRRRRQGRARPRAGGACRGAPAGRAPSSAGPSSTQTPSWSTATRSAISATTPKSWVMNRTAVP